MISVVPEEESNVTRLKKKSQLHNCAGVTSHEESRSFLNFSRENLSISNSDLEQGFRRTPRFRCWSSQSFLSYAALLLALSCVALELWKLRRVFTVARDVENLKRDVETLKHRFLEKDLLDELKAFEEQLYGEDLSAEDDSSTASSGNDSDYDSSYEDSSFASYTPVNQHAAAITPRTLDAGDLGTTSPRPVTPCTSKDLEDVLAVLRRAEAEHGKAFEHNVRAREKIIEEEEEDEEDDGEGEVEEGETEAPREHGAVAHKPVAVAVERSKRQVSGMGSLRKQNSPHKAGPK